MSPEAEAFAPVAAALDSLGASYCIVGSVAAYAHGFARATADVDVVVAKLKPEHAQQLVQALGQEFYADEVAIAEAVREEGSFNLIHDESGFKVDIFVRNSARFEQEILQRRRLAPLFEDEEPQFWVQSVEDLVLSKLRWFRLGRGISDRQWNDILSVLKVNTFDLDFDYLDRWARELSVTDLLEKALDEAGLNGKL